MKDHIKNDHLNWGLIGIGGVGALHQAAIEHLAETSNIRLIAAADPALDRLDAERSHLDQIGVESYSCFKTMLEGQPKLDGVTIAAPIPYHFEIAKECLQRNLHVLLEKPPTPLLSQLDQLIKLDAEQRVSVGFQMIGSECFQKLKTAISNGELGEIISIRAGACWPRNRGYYERAPWAGRIILNDQAVIDGPLSNALAHLVNAVTYFASSRQEQFESASTIEAELYRAWNIETYDTAHLKGQFDNGIEFSIAVTHATEHEHPYEIVIQGSKGKAILKKDGGELLLPGQPTYRCTESTQILINKCYTDFINYINGSKDKPTVTLRDSSSYVHVIDAMIQSAATIQNIPIEFCNSLNSGEHEIISVEGLYSAVLESIESGASFHDQKLDWTSSNTLKLQVNQTRPLSMMDLMSFRKRSNLTSSLEAC